MLSMFWKQYCSVCWFICNCLYSLGMLIGCVWCVSMQLCVWLMSQWCVDGVLLLLLLVGCVQVLNSVVSILVCRLLCCVLGSGLVIVIVLLSWWLSSVYSCVSCVLLICIMCCVNNCLLSVWCLMFLVQWCSMLLCMMMLQIENCVGVISLNLMLLGWNVSVLGLMWYVLMCVELLYMSGMLNQYVLLCILYVWCSRWLVDL